MRALVYQGPQQITLEVCDLPICTPDEVIIQVEAVGICGSELEGYLGHSSIRKPPLIMGHEFCGIVSSIGEHVLEVAIGDKVVVNPLLTCGRCDRCLMGKGNVCRKRSIVGIHRPGAFAQFVAVPSANVYKVPPEMDSGLASLAEPLAVAIHSIKLGIKPLDDLLIFGAGPIGLLTLQAARQMGAGKVMIVELQQARLQHVQRLGAEVASPDELEARIKVVFPQGVNTIIDCVGVQATREQALRLINPGGSIIMVGLGQDKTLLDVNHLVRQEVSFIGSYTYAPLDFQQAIQLLLQGAIDVEGWTESRDLAEGPTAFQQLVEGKTKASKIFLKL